MAINPTGPMSTPILTYATPAQRKAVGQESEEDKPRPLPPVEQGQQSEANAYRRRNPNRIENEETASHQQSTGELLAEDDAVENAEDALGDDISSGFSNATINPSALRPPKIGVDDVLNLAAAGLQYRQGDGEK